MYYIPDKRGHIMYYEDSLGYRVNVGTVVGWDENFCDGTEKDGKSYVVRNLPNFADMVEMQEIPETEDLTDWSDESVNTTKKLDTPVISVEPYKVGAI
jgi:hypothetical protein